MKGRRLPNKPANWYVQDVLPGDYVKVGTLWWVCPPRGGIGILDHEVTEHEDGTVTVSPSILCDEWHGYLEHGVWREA